jgi:signal transduction histidine kinase
VQDLLALTGVAVSLTRVRTLGEAIERPQQSELEGFDCILLDLDLPDAFGLASLQRVREAMGDVPVLVLTGRADEQRAIEAVAGGAQDYVASHDLQEPLRKIASFCQMLERRYGEQLDDRAREYIAFAVDGAKRMQDLINDLLTFSRVGRIGAAHGEVPLGAVLAGVQHDLGTAIEETGAHVEVGALPTVHGDPTLLAVVFRNLIGNAIKFHGDEPPHVVVAAKRDGEMWDFTVSDNGIGIEPEYAERIFVIFQRLHTRQAYEGTGRRSAARSSSITAGASGSRRPATAPAPRSGSRCRRRSTRRRGRRHDPAGSHRRPARGGRSRRRASHPRGVH